MGEQQSNADFLNDFVVTIRKPKSEGERPKLPELTWLPATIKQIKKKQLPKSQTVRAQFTFVISTGKYKDQYAWGSVPLHEEITEKADLYRWICNILGKESLEVDENVKIGDLVGKRVEVMVKNTKGTNGTIYQNVTEVRVPETEVEDDCPTEEVVVTKPEVKTPTKKVETKTAPKATVKKEAPKAEPVEEEESGLGDLDEKEEPTEQEISEDDLPF
jgi:hypothetical protein